MMALMGIAPEVMRPSALVLNILVAGIATIRFYRSGSFSWSLFWPFALTSIPFAFIGGSLTLPGGIYRPIVGLVLLYAAVRLFWAVPTSSQLEIRPVPRWAALLIGLALGLLSGLVGVGGGIFLSPLLILMGWADTRQTASVSALFIVVNSAAGLLGQLTAAASLPPAIPMWGAAAAVGGWIGAGYGSRRFQSVTLRRLLAVVLVIAGVKLLFT
jgi:uncharacterized membrane protein YfcA